MSFIIIDDNLFKIEGNDPKLLSMGNKFLESRFDDTEKVKIKSKFKKLKQLEKLLNKNELENVKKNWGNNFLNQIAKIKKNDPVAKYFFAQEGDVFEISNNADYINYRICTKL